MSVDLEQVVLARVAFVDAPSNNTAAYFFSKLREAEEEGTIGDDEFHNGLAEIECYLWTSKIVP